MVDEEDALEENVIPGEIKWTFWKITGIGKNNPGNRISVQIQVLPTASVVPSWGVGVEATNMTHEKYKITPS